MKAKINKGISLIVLVITIIIMIILATAVILSLSSSNIVDKATLAKYKSDLSNLQEIIVAKVAERQLSNQDTSGRYVLSDWNIENSEYEDKVIIDNAKIVLRVTDNEGLIAAATELGISKVSSSETTTLANTKGLNLLNYRIYGNSVQDGTPTPTAPVEVLSLGENRSIEVVSSGKNLFGKNRISSILSQSYLEPSFNMTIDTFKEKLRGKILTLSCREIPSDMRMAFFIFGTRTDSTETYWSSQYGVLGSNRYTFEVPNTLNFSTITWVGVRFWRPAGANNEAYTFEDIQLELGNAPTLYEPYQTPITTTIDLSDHEPLRKVGDVADYIDYKNKKIVRNIYKKVFKGTEVFRSNNYDKTTNYAFSVSASDRISIPGGNGICTHYIFAKYDYASANNYGKVGFDSSGTAMSFTSTDVFSTELEFKSWLAEQYANGKPLTVYYQLAKPIEETFGCPEIPTLKGTTILTVKDANGIQSSNIITEY